MLGLLGFALLVTLIFVWAACLYATYHRIRRKGYQPPGTLLLLALACAAPAAIAIAVAPADLQSASAFRFLAFTFNMPLLLCVALMAIVALVLPARTARRFGARTSRVPFRVIGWGFIVLGVVAAVVTVLALFNRRWDALRGITLVVMLMTIGAYAMWFGGHQKERLGADSAMAADTRPPVLYLRPFRQESQFFVIGRKAKYGAYTASLHARLAQDQQYIGVTLEDFLDEAVESALGPFVALGSPEDYLPPEGAARTYARDDGWQTQFGALAERASAILVEAGASGHLTWEFGELRRRGLHGKLFLLWPPQHERGTALAWWFYGLLWRLKGIRRPAWEQFAADLRALGLHLTQPPPPGSVIGFDPDGTSVVIASGADQPAGFIDPIAERVAKPRV